MRCAYCNSDKGPFHREHVVPRSRGGPDEPINLVMACGACNAAKGIRLPSEWLAHVPPEIEMIERRVSSMVAREARGGRRGEPPVVAPPRVHCAGCGRHIHPTYDGAHLAWWVSNAEPARLLDIEVLCTGMDRCLRRKEELMHERHGLGVRLLDVHIEQAFGRWAWLCLRDLVTTCAMDRAQLVRVVELMRQLSKAVPAAEPPTTALEDDDPTMVDD